MRTTATIIDLFCGCGGFGLGAEYAGFHSLAAVDIDSTLQSSYRLNFPQTNVVNADIATLDNSAWTEIIGGQRPDGVIGGPPCQGFSRIGKRVEGDPRNSLIGSFFHQVSLLKPKFFVMENVEGLLDKRTADILTAALEIVLPTYTVVDPIIVNAADFGAPTKRRRVIIVGYDKSCVDPISAEDLAPTGPRYLPTVEDAISDLPSPIETSKRDGGFGWARFTNRELSDISPYARDQRAPPSSQIGWSLALKKLAVGEISGLFDTKHSLPVSKRFSNTEPGTAEPISRYPRLSWDGFCPTLRAGTGIDRGSFQAMRPIHPSEPRVVTVREAARMQGFPDWYVFHPAKWHSFRMIGNSVSPPVARAILRNIYRKINHTLVARV